VDLFNFLVRSINLDICVLVIVLRHVLSVQVGNTE